LVKAASRTLRSARAVIGGLLVATFYTLFFVLPIAYSVLQRTPRCHVDSEEK